MEKIIDGLMVQIHYHGEWKPDSAIMERASGSGVNFGSS